MKNIILLLLVSCSISLNAQNWANENRGLYPNSLSVTINARNTALGVRGVHLFQEPVLNMPIGVYGSFSNTVNPNLKYINYNWERKYSMGALITLPHSFESKLTHTALSIGAIYNSHTSPPGQFQGDLYYTSYWGCDIGVHIQINHFTSHIVCDVFNFMRYVEFGCGYAFSFYKSR